MEPFYDRNGDFQGSEAEYLEDIAADDAAREAEANWSDFADDHAEWQAWSPDEIDDAAYLEWVAEQERADIHRAMLEDGEAA